MSRIVFAGLNNSQSLTWLSVGLDTSAKENRFADGARGAIMDTMTASNSDSVSSSSDPHYALVTGAGSGLGRAFCSRFAYKLQQSASARQTQKRPARVIENEKNQALAP